MKDYVMTIRMCVDFKVNLNQDTDCYVIYHLLMSWNLC